MCRLTVAVMLFGLVVLPAMVVPMKLISQVLRNQGTTKRMKVSSITLTLGVHQLLSLISCSDQRCRKGLESSCNSQNNRCTYNFQYGDRSVTSGYYVSDLMHLASIAEGSFLPNSSARMVFGCSNLQTGHLTGANIDGIYGFGQHGMSVISQLTSQGIASGVFSHCLKGDSSGGGILVLGEIVEPNIIYSPLVPSQIFILLQLGMRAIAPSLT